MKDVLTHLHTSMDMERLQDSSLADITSCYPEFQTPPRNTLIPKDDNDQDLDQNSNSSSNGESYLAFKSHCFLVFVEHTCISKWLALAMCTFVVGSALISHRILSFKMNLPSARKFEIAR